MSRASEQQIAEQEAEERLRDAAPALLHALKTLLGQEGLGLSFTQRTLVAKAAIEHATGKKP